MGAKEKEEKGKEKKEKLTYTRDTIFLFHATEQFNCRIIQVIHFITGLSIRAGALHPQTGREKGPNGTFYELKVSALVLLVLLSCRIHLQKV